jgi:hypothetical protein
LFHDVHKFSLLAGQREGVGSRFVFVSG